MTAYIGAIGPLNQPENHPYELDFENRWKVSMVNSS